MADQDGWQLALHGLVQGQNMNHSSSAATLRGGPVFLRKPNKGASVSGTPFCFLEGKKPHCVTQGDGITLLVSHCIPLNQIPQTFA